MLSWFLAQRFIFIAEKRNTINTMITVCFWGILISTFSLALVDAIMRGFERATHKKLQGIHADVIVNAHDKPLKYEALAHVITKEFSTRITAFAPHSDAPAMIRKKNIDTFPVLISLTGIDPIREQGVTTLPQLIQAPQKPLDLLLIDNGILIGQELADELQVTVGDAIELYTASESGSGRMSLALESHHARIAGIFKTGIDELDAHVVFCALSQFNTLFPDKGITSVLLTLSPNAREKQVITDLRRRINLSVHSWKDLYPALVSALILEKYAMFIILALISLIATMNIMSLLFMYITQKKGEIVLLRTLGISDATISLTFILIGMGIAAAAAFFGVLCAGLVSYLLETYPFISLPDVYYVTHVPADMSITSACIVFCVVLILSFFATWIPTRKIYTISVTEVLKKEL